ncbi:MAG: hypothetical protein A3J57_00400 [Candidatus Wildermuthbacteria bacterium RIFCSPHIGHO2_02_FULL_49_12b]|nr:MAG: hypothetical protein A3J57_00400 [Candidatus Wildermuthbacteria bacterium RIFCSPHIGHO2_02_FULL_49_12b]
MKKIGWSNFMESQKKEKTFVVSLKGLAPWVSAIRYEKERDDVKLHITLAKETRPAVIVEESALGGKLSQRMFKNLEYHQLSSLYISLLSEQDFKDCGANGSNLKNCLVDLKNSAPDLSLLLVAQIPGKESKGFLWTHRESLRVKIAQGFESKTKGNWVVFRPEENAMNTKSRVLSLAGEL